MSKKLCIVYTLVTLLIGACWGEEQSGILVPQPD